MLVVTFLVDAMSAKHKNNWARRCKHILSTNRAVAVRDSLDTFVGMLVCHLHTNSACLASTSAFASKKKTQIHVPCNGKNLFQGHGLSYICHNHYSDICSYLDRYPIAYTRHSNTMLFSHHTWYSLLRLAGHIRTAYKAYSWWLAGLVCDSRPHHDIVGKFTTDHTLNTAASHFFCNVDIQELEARLL